MDAAISECINDLIKTEEDYECTDNISTDTTDYEAQTTLFNNCFEMNNEATDNNTARLLKRKISDSHMPHNKKLFQQQAQQLTLLHTGVEQQEDLELLALLTEWKLERLYRHFLRQGISVYVLKIMKNHHIEKLFNGYNVGTMAYFEHCLENWRNSNMPLNMNSQADNTLLPTKPLVTTQQNYAAPTETSVAFILNSSKYGLMLLQFYEEHKEFREEDRQRLIGLIAHYYDQHDIHMSLPFSYKIEQDIIELFPTEKIEFYRTSKRGRIYNKYCNVKKSSKNLKTHINSDNKIPHESETTAATTLCPEKDAEITISHLKQGQLSANEFENYWQECRNYRISHIKESSSLEEVFKKWPEYKCVSKGYRLIHMDFSFLYPNQTSIVNKWEEMQEALFTTLDNDRSIRNKTVKIAFSNIKNATKNGKAATLMWATHAFLVPWQREVTKDLTGKKIFTRFTISDSQNSFLLLCGNTKEMESSLNSRNINSPPIIMAISNDISVIEEVFVCFADSQYRFEDFIGAVDMCFKIFHLFHIEYPKASSNFWNFIQNFFYEIKSKEQSAKISILMETLKKTLQIPCANIMEK